MATPIPSGSSVRLTPVIDPALQTPLPDDNDNDFPPAHQILTSIACPATKVAGSRRVVHPNPKGKGKQREVVPPIRENKRTASHVPSEEPDAKRRRGRGPGTANYSAEDIDGLLDILEELLPTGGKGWNTAGDEFKLWAEENGRPVRTAKSLESKYKQVSLPNFCSL